MKVVVRTTDDGMGTTVQADGNDLHGVTAVRFSHSAGDLPRLEVDLFGAEIHVEGKTAFLAMHPADATLKEVARIVFADNSVWEAE